MKFPIRKKAPQHRKMLKVFSLEFWIPTGRKVTAGLAALVLTVLGVSSSNLAAASPDTAPSPTATSDACLKHRYYQDLPGHEETFFDEWQFRTRTPLFGEVEHKYVPGQNFVSGGTTTLEAYTGNNVTISGHWVAGTPGVWGPIPDSVINIVWGPSGIPDSLIGGSEASPKGNVDLDVYGYPGNGPVVPYYATKETTTAGFTDWGPWSAWSTTNPGAETDTMQVGHRQTSNNDYVAPKTVYYLPGGGQSDTLTDANWTGTNPGSPWVLVDESPQDTCVKTEACDTYGSVHTTDLATWIDKSRSAGRNFLVAAGNHVYTIYNTVGSPDPRKAAMYYPASFDLKDIGDETNANRIDFVNLDPGSFPYGPGPQVLVDFDNDSSNNHIVFSDGDGNVINGDGILVFEAVYGDYDVWLSNESAAYVKAGAPSHTGGSGSDNHGPVNDWVAAFLNAKVSGIGYSLGSGVNGNDVITRITFGCVNYTFGLPGSPAPDSYPVVTWNDPECSTDGTGTVRGTKETWAQDKDKIVWDEESQTWKLPDYELVKTEEVTRDATSEECPITIQPKDPFKDLCGVDNDTVTPEVIAGATFAVDDQRDANGVGWVFVKYTADDGKQFADGVQTMFAHYFTNEVCDTLAYTNGVEIAAIGMLGTLAIGGIVVGIALIVIKRRRPTEAIEVAV